MPCKMHNILLAIVLLFTTKIVKSNTQSGDIVAKLLERLEKQERRIECLEQTIANTSSNTIQQRSKDDGVDFTSSNSFPRPHYMKEKRAGGSICSFYVSLSHDLHLHTDAPVIFDEVKLNENGCYNNGDGVFVVSLDGIYMFQWKITTHSGGYAGVYLEKNGKSVGMPLQVRSDNGDLIHNSASDFAILRLQRGDHVYLVASMEPSFIHAGHSGFGGIYLTE